MCVCDCIASVLDLFLLLLKPSQQEYNYTVSIYIKNWATKKEKQKIKDGTTRASSPLYIQVLTVCQVSPNIVTDALPYFFFILIAVLLPAFISQRICTTILYLYILPARKN